LTDTRAAVSIFCERQMRRAAAGGISVRLGGHPAGSCGREGSRIPADTSDDADRSPPELERTCVWEERPSGSPARACAASQ